MMKIKSFLVVFILLVGSVTMAQVTVNSLAELQAAVTNSNQTITLTAGIYFLEDLPSTSRVITCTGSENIIDLTGVEIKTRVGSIREAYFNISGDNNILRNGTITDFYQNGLDEVTDYSAYNKDATNLAYGLKGAPIMQITGNGNLVVGLEMTVKGSFPYGYGSQYGIGAVNTFGLNKRCGILITGSAGGGIGNTLDSITMHHHAFGHGIYMQSGATETTIKNTYVEGRMRLSDDMYNDTETYDLPYRTNYLFPGDGAASWKEADMPWTDSYPIPYGQMYPLSEDGIRSYSNTGTVVVENCTIKQMRGGIRLYLASGATVTNSTAIDCGATNYNMPKNGTITGSRGNFSYAPLSDFRLDRSNQKIEMTILLSPNATGTHNIADILGGYHDIVFHRTPGPLDSDEERVIVVYGNGSTIVNETEYTIVLQSGTSGNTVTSCGPVIDNGNNTVIRNNCTFDLGTPPCSNSTALLEAECYEDMNGIQTEASTEGTDNVGWINNGDWLAFSNVNLTGMNSFKARVSGKTTGSIIEVRLGSETGALISTLEISNTGGNQNWVTDSTNIIKTNGIHDVYFVFKGGAGYLYNINWFGFSEESIIITSLQRANQIAPSVFPNPSTGVVHLSEETGFSVFNAYGQQVRTGTGTVIDLSNEPNGVYILKTKGQIQKIVKK